MMNYDRLVFSVITCLHTAGYSTSKLKDYHQCFGKLKHYLAFRGIDYSPPDADAWLNSVKIRYSQSTLNNYRSALLKIQDVYDYGSIQPDHFERGIKPVLSEPEQKIVDDYFDTLNDYSKSVVSGIKSAVYHFFGFIQQDEINGFSEISYQTIHRFYDRENQHFGIYKHSIDTHVSSFFKYCADAGLCTHGYALLLHYIFIYENMFWMNVPAEQMERIKELSEYSDFSNEDLYKTIRDIRQWLKNKSYSKGAIGGYILCLDLLYLFLDMNDFSYSPEIAWIWYNSTEDKSYAVRTQRRALCLLEEFIKNSDVRLPLALRYTPSSIDTLPDWCRPAAQQYICNKKSEKWSSNTIAMIRASIYRFFSYLDSHGICSFQEISASIIKQFNLDDQHKTPEGKNAYNGRIRKFLIYLGEQNLLQNRMLFAALPHISSAREKIIITLTDEEQVTFFDRIQGPEISLRDKAILLLGRRLGMRGKDIIELTVSSIDWKQESIRFVQSKTQVELVLPLTEDVGNAIYRYLTEDRPETESDSLFIRERAPFEGPSRNICREAMNSAVPERNVSGSGFHVLRKTRATELLENNVDMNSVSEILGHTSNNTVMTYLSLDEKNMRRCGLSLSETGLVTKLDGDLS